MPNRFNHFIKNALLINLAVLAIAFIIMISYMDRYDLSFSALFQSSNVEFTFYDNWNVNVFDINTQQASQFTTKTIEKTDTFDVTDTIVIENNIERIEFVHENRDNILVHYKRDLPDTRLYNVTYSAKRYEDKLVIKSELNVNNLSINTSYDGSITIHVPDDYVCENLTIDSNIVTIGNTGIPNRTHNLLIHSDYGTVDLDFEQAMDQVSIQINAGTINLLANEDINSLIINSDSSAIELESKASIDALKIINNVGTIQCTLYESPKSFILNSDVAKDLLIFNKPIEHLDLTASMGEVNIDVSDNDNGIVYKSVNLSDFHSVLTTTNLRDDANIYISMDLGSVDIY